MDRARYAENNIFKTSFYAAVNTNATDTRLTFDEEVTFKRRLFVKRIYDRLTTPTPTGDNVAATIWTLINTTEAPSDATNANKNLVEMKRFLAVTDAALYAAPVVASS